MAKNEHMFLFLGSLLGSLGDFAGTLLRLLNVFDDTDGDGQAHVTDGESAEWRVLLE